MERRPPAEGQACGVGAGEWKGDPQLRGQACGVGAGGQQSFKYWEGVKGQI